MTVGPEHQALIHSDLSRADELGAQIREAYADLARRSHALIEASAGLEAELEALRGKHSATEAERQGQATQVARLQAQAAQQALEIEQAQHEIAQVQERLRDALAKRIAAETEARTHLSRIGDLQQNEGSLKHELDFAREDAESHRQNHIQAQTRLSELESERKELAARVATHQDLHQKALHDAAQLQRQIEEHGAQASRRRHAEQALLAEAQHLLELEPAMVAHVQDISSAHRALDGSGDHEALSRLAPALAEFAGHWKDRQDEAQAVDARVAQLGEELAERTEAVQAAERERDEIAASGKEVISQLTGQRETREAELSALRAQVTASTTRLEGLRTLTHLSVAAVRRLGDACAQMAEAAGESHLDLDAALTRLPAEDEEISVEPETLNEVAQAGVSAAQALARRHAAQLVQTGRIERERIDARGRLDESARELERLRAALQEGESAARRHQGEVTAVRREMAEQSAALAAKIQEHSQARAELVSMIADRDADQERLHNHERRTQELQAALSERAQVLAEHERSAHVLQRRCDAAEANQAAMAQALGSLTSWQPVHDQAHDALAQATQKFELARAGGSDELAEAGRSLAAAVQERSRALAERLTSAQGEISAAAAARERFLAEVATLKAALIDRDGTISVLGGERERLEAQHQSLLKELMGAQKGREALASELEESKHQMRFALAEVDDLRARDQASSGHNADEITQLRKKLTEHDASGRAQEAALAEHKERHEASEARMRRTREEFQRMLEERDHIIRDKDQLLDDLGARRVDVKGLEAQAVAMAAQIATANDRIKELEAALGIHAGSNVKSLDLARELRRAQAERDAQRDRLRQLEGDLADALSQHTESATQLDEKRKEVMALREQFMKESAEEREKTNQMREEFRRLKEEVVGLRARLRRLTETK